MKNGLTQNEMQVLSNYKGTDALIDLPKMVQDLFKSYEHKKAATYFLRNNFRK